MQEWALSSANNKKLTAVIPAGVGARVQRDGALFDLE